MAMQTTPKLVSAIALGVLVFILGLILLVIAAPLFIPGPSGTSAIVFSISRRSFTIGLVAFLTVLGLAVFSIALARGRRHLN